MVSHRVSKISAFCCVTLCGFVRSYIRIEPNSMAAFVLDSPISFLHISVKQTRGIHKPPKAVGLGDQVS